MDIFYVYIDDCELKDKYNIHHTAGRYIVECAAKIYGIKNSELIIVNNKPKFEFADIQFSISHSKNIAAVCFDENPVGLDIEYIKNRDYKAVAKRMSLLLENDSLEGFYKAWTAYEAEYKLGVKAYAVKSQRFEDNYMISIASTKEIKSIKFDRLEYSC